MDDDPAKRFTKEPESQPLPSGQRSPAWVRSIEWSAIAEAIVAGGVILAICHFAKLVWITLMIAALLAFILDPMVTMLERRRLPRPLGAFLVLFLVAGMAAVAGYFSYNRAAAFVREIPHYSSRVRSALVRLERKTQQIEKAPQENVPIGEQEALPVKVTDLGSLFSQVFGAAAEAAITLGFVPFLVYFMLTWRNQAWEKTVRLFPREHRDEVRHTLGEISSMMRSFLVGNIVIGALSSLASMAVFGALGLRYFYFLAFISGFLSLVPYLGALLALGIPMVAGIGVLNSSGMLIVAGSVLSIHLLAINVLYPKLIGGRVELNPLVVTVSLLFWAWLWGAMGLILAIPIVAAIKIVCDHIGGLEAFGEWMGN